MNLARAGPFVQEHVEGPPVLFILVSVEPETLVAAKLPSHELRRALLVLGECRRNHLGLGRRKEGTKP